MVKHLDIKIKGEVQGVFFRFYTKEEAEKLSLVGFARNETDGSVYIEVEGKQQNLEKFVEWCKTGPNSADVKNIEIRDGKMKNFEIFEIF